MRLETKRFEIELKREFFLDLPKAGQRKIISVEEGEGEDKGKYYLSVELNPKKKTQKTKFRAIEAGTIIWDGPCRVVGCFKSGKQKNTTHLCEF